MRHLSLLLLLTLSLSLEAQEFPFRRYGTQAHMDALFKSDSTLAERQSATERFTSEYRITGQPDTAVIPVVFHVLYPDGGSAPAPADLDLQIQLLNELFYSSGYPPVLGSSGTDVPAHLYRHPADSLEGFAARAASPQIRFCIPATDTAGNIFNGAVWASVVSTGVLADDYRIKHFEAGGSTAWNTARYLNIWVAPLPDSTLAGYAQMPGGPADRDGIVLNSRFLARAAWPEVQQRYGRSLAHLVGSWLNVYELWSDLQYCADDYVWDTPIHNAPNYGNPPYKHVSTCYDNPVEMTMNIMDNTDDEAQYMFTRGQIMRMHAVLSPDGARGGLRQTLTLCDPERPAITGPAFQRPGESSSDNAAPLKGALHAYPNPARDLLYVSVSGVGAGAATVRLFDDIGHLTYSFTAQHDGVFTVPVADWAPGLYIVQALLESGPVSVRVVVE
jgi:hypothetical protein